MTRRRIGLFGGSFDPMHNAHVALARLARDQLALDELRLMPAGRPWQKQDRVLASAEHRAAMVALAIEGEPRMHMECCELSTPGPHYTMDTLQVLQAEAPGDWFLVLGQDQYARLHTWHRWRELLSRVTFAVAARDGQPPAAGPEVATTPHRVVELPLPPLDVSSSELRVRIARGESIAGMVPAPVASYIDRNHLYRS